MEIIQTLIECEKCYWFCYRIGLDGEYLTVFICSMRFPLSVYSLGLCTFINSIFLPFSQPNIAMRLLLPYHHPPILPVSNYHRLQNRPSPQKPGGRGPRPLRPIRGGVKGPAFPALPDQVDRLPSIESVWRVGVGAEAGVGTVGTVLG